MKLYSKTEMIRNMLIGIAVGAFIVGSGTMLHQELSERANDEEIAKAESAQEENADSSENSTSEVAAKSEDLPSVTQTTNEQRIDELTEKYDALLSQVKTIAASESRYTIDEQQNIAVYEKCNEAVVNITTQEMAYNWFFEPVLQDGGSGSGSIIDKRGYVVTNVHVIEKAQKINISLSDGSTYEGQVVGKDVESDIAVLKFDPGNKILKTIQFGNSDNLKVGQKVIAIGNPFALERTMTTGIISGLGRPIQERQNVIIRNMIQTDAAINPGNSGGPLLDSSGRMIGINTMIISNSGSSAGLGFAVPVSTAQRVVKDLIQSGKVTRGRLGISAVQMSSDIANYINSQRGQMSGLSRVGINYGILISNVDEGSSAEKSGLKGGTVAVRNNMRQSFNLGGDIIVAIDGISVSSYADYLSALESKRPGDTVTVTVYRNGGTEKIKTKLD